MFAILTGIFTSAIGFITSKVAGWGVMRLIKSPVAWAGAGVLGIFLAYQAGNWQGYSRATTRCNAAAAQAKLEAANRDAEIQLKAEAMAKRERDALAKLAVDLDRKVAEYEAELRKRPDRCVATDGDVRRLRSLGK